MGHESDVQTNETVYASTDSAAFALRRQQIAKILMPNSYEEVFALGVILHGGSIYANEGVRAGGHQYI